MNKALRQQIEASLDTIRPYLEKDGGNIELVNITEENIVQVNLLGNCIRCPMSFMTMKAGVEESLRKSIPDLKGVEVMNLEDT